MGVCCGQPRNVAPPSAKETNTSAINLLHYPRSANVHIKVKDEKGRVLTDEQIHVNLTEPTMSFSTPVSLGKWKAWASGTLHSGCILPGLDPRGREKVCQDLVFIETFPGFTLAGVMDGHGPNGDQVVAFCKKFVYDFIVEKQGEMASNPSAFLTRMTEACDNALQRSDCIVDCLASGSTAVFLLYYRDVVYFSSVGDSRGIIATISPPEECSAIQPPRGDDRALLHEIKVRRSVCPDMELNALQMTVDQKPEDPVELERIQRAGGMVMRLEDEDGRRVGPYRVWKVENMYPGIAMSRSLGDKLAHEVGVISTPILTQRTLKEGEDFFIVIGSDGVWDMMENQEVCDFVEAFRLKCVRNMRSASYVDVVEPGNVCISHLLCEEARARWLAIVEAEDVQIDDISCLVVELVTHLPSKKKAPARNLYMKRDDTQDVPGLDKAVRLGKLTGDMVRSPSLKKEEESPNAKEEVDTSPAVAINDVRRSSVSDFKSLNLS